MLKQFISLLLLLPAVSVAAPQHANRTFTMMVIGGNHEPDIVGAPVLVAPPTGITSVVVGNNFTVAAEVLKAFIYNGHIYRTCKTSPTGACLGFLTKAYGGALTGWYFQFSDNEKPYNLGPGDGPILGDFAVNPDPDTPACKHGQKLLFWGSSRFWTMCSMEPGIYNINSSPIPPFAINGPQCANHTNYMFKVQYT